MATFKKRNGRYQAQIRRKGYAPTYKTFSSITAAKKWVQVTEADMERRTYAPAPSISVCEILERYEREVLPSHKGHQVERYRVQTLLGFFGGLKLAHLTPKDVAQYRDIRLKEVSPASLKRELTIFSQALTTASKDWGIALPRTR